MGFETVSVSSESFKAKATLLTAKGMIGISVQIYFILSSGRNVSLLEVRPLCHIISFLQVRRGKGDIMEFHNAFSDLNRRIAPLINTSS